MRPASDVFCRLTGTAGSASVATHSCLAWREHFRTSFQTRIDLLGQSRACIEQFKNNAALDSKRLEPCLTGTLQVTPQIDPCRSFSQTHKHRAPVHLTRTATVSFKTASATIMLDRDVTLVLRPSCSRPKMRPAGSYNPHFKEEHPKLCAIIFPRVREMGACFHGVRARFGRRTCCFTSPVPANPPLWRAGSGNGEEGRPLTPPSPPLRNLRFLESSITTTKAASTAHP